MSSHCHHPDCSWVSLETLNNYTDAPPLQPEPEVSGIGVILGFAMTAYLTLLLLIVNYAFAFDPHKWGNNGRRYTNPLDLKLLGFIRSSIKWRPTRRLEYSMEKAVLILSDTQLVTGLAILSSGYSQLNCGISAYHWQIMVYVAWFASFSFISAMTFLQAFFQANHSLRIIRICFMFLLGSMMIVALLPTGSKDWMNLACYDDNACFYPSLQAICFYRQMSTNSFDNSHTKMYSMILSMVVVGLSYINCGIKMFDPSSIITRRYIRMWPRKQANRVLGMLDKMSQSGGFTKVFFRLLYLAAYSVFMSARALYDIAESMLGEIMWLTWAIAWGSIKLWTTRVSGHFNAYGYDTDANPGILSEDSWTFGQTLPLVLLFLPVMSMLQVYFDHDTKILEAVTGEQWIRKTSIRDPGQKPAPDNSINLPVALSSISIGRTVQPNPSDYTKRPSATIDDTDDGCACQISRCVHHPSQCPISTNPSVYDDTKRPSTTAEIAQNGSATPISRWAHLTSQCPISTEVCNDTKRPSTSVNSDFVYSTARCFDNCSRAATPNSHPQRSRTSSTSSISSASLDPAATSPLPPYLNPATDPYKFDAYHDHIALWILQISLLSALILWLLNASQNVLGISFFLRNRLFLIWMFAILPSSQFLHLAIWQVAAWTWVTGGGERRWKRWVGEKEDEDRTSQATAVSKASKRKVMVGQWVYRALRAGLVIALAVYTFMVSFEAGGPEALYDSLASA